METQRISGTPRGLWLLFSAAFAAFLTGWAWPVLAQFPDVDSPTECPGCRAALVRLSQAEQPSRRPALEGTWSSPLTTPADSAWSVEDFLCFVACTPEARTAATALVNAAEESHPISDLLAQVIGINARGALSLQKQRRWQNGLHADIVTSPAPSSVLGAPAAYGAGLPFAKPSCNPFAFPTQVVSALPLKIEHRADRLVFRYEEFGAVRTILFDGRGDPSADPSLPLGLSRGRFEDNAFVVETTDIPPGRFYDWFGGIRYSDKLHAVERYTTSDDGQWLDLTLRLEDPETLEAPLTLLKRWHRAPDLEILPYSCDAISGQR
jgi:hypothetical protein